MVHCIAGKHAKKGAPPATVWICENEILSPGISKNHGGLFPSLRGLQGNPLGSLHGRRAVPVGAWRAFPPPPRPGPRCGGAVPHTLSLTPRCPSCPFLSCALRWGQQNRPEPAGTGWNRPCPARGSPSALLRGEPAALLPAPACRHLVVLIPLPQQRSLNEHPAIRSPISLFITGRAKGTVPPPFHGTVASASINPVPVFERRVADPN